MRDDPVTPDIRALLLQIATGSLVVRQVAPTILEISRPRSRSILHTASPIFDSDEFYEFLEHGRRRWAASLS